MLLRATFPNSFDEVWRQRMVLTAGTQEQELERPFDQFLMWLLNENVLKDSFNGDPLSKVIVVQKDRVP